MCAILARLILFALSDMTENSRFTVSDTRLYRNNVPTR